MVLNFLLNASTRIVPWSFRSCLDENAVAIAEGMSPSKTGSETGWSAPMSMDSVNSASFSWLWATVIWRRKSASPNNGALLLLLLWQWRRAIFRLDLTALLSRLNRECCCDWRKTQEKGNQGVTLCLALSMI